MTGSPMLAALGSRLVGVEGISGPVVVACSGGADSVALLALATARGWPTTAVHVDHGLRPGGRAEAALVAAHAARLGAEFASERVTVAPGSNVEARARSARYDALERARARVHATTILVGHTADDLAETVVLNVLRGSAAAGLGGIAVTRARVVRPMLGLRRRETGELCGALGLEVFHDPSNDDLAHRRNWVRHELLPKLARELDHDLVPVLARQADLLREDSQYLDELARAAWPSDGSAPAGVLAAMPVVLARRAVRQWLGPPPPSLAEVGRVLAVVRGECRATEVSGGRRVRRSRGRLFLEQPSATRQLEPMAEHSTGSVRV